MRFKQITIIDKTRLTHDGLLRLQAFSENPLITYEVDPASESETLDRITGSDCILVSWKTAVPGAVLKKATNLVYIGMCCSLYDPSSSNVDIRAAEKLGITVTAVNDYGDEGVVEFIFAQLIYHFKGLDRKDPQKIPTELSSKSIGIIGLGTVGKMVAAAARIFGMDVYYSGRSKKVEAESLGIKMLPLDKLMQSCDIVTIHVPRNSLRLDEVFSLKRKNSIFINTSLGQPFAEQALVNWLNNDPESLAIFDSDGAGELYGKLSSLKNVILYPLSAGLTEESGKRLSQKVLANIHNYFDVEK